MPITYETTPSVGALWHDYANLFPMISGDALDRLREDIREHGVREPIIFLDGKILDGRNRYMCARDLGIEYPRVEFAGADPLAYVISHNLHRRHLTESQRAMVASKLANMPRGGNRVEHHSANLHSASDAADMLNVSERSVKSARKVRDEGTPELQDAVERGDVSVSAAADVSGLPHVEQSEIVARGDAEILAAAKNIRKKRAEDRKAKNAEVRAKAIPSPAGTYDVLVLDPPWPMEKIERDVRPNQVAFDYPTMGEDELSMMKLPAADAAHVFLWTTHKFLPMAFRMMDVWSIRYVCTMVWHKPGGFQPIGLPQYNCEFVLYGRIGSPTFCDTKAFPACFNAPRGAHSEKPAEFYDVVRRVTDGRRIDMFNRRQIDGFDGWGNQSVSMAS